MAQAFPIPRNESLRLARVQQLCPIDDSPDDVLDQIIALAAAHFRVPIALVSIVDQHRQWFRAKVGLSANGTGRRESFCAHAIVAEELFEVPDAMLDERFRDNPLVVGEPGIRFYAGMPLMTEDGLGLGSLCVIDTQPRPPLSVQERACLMGLARLVLARIHDLRRINFIDNSTGMFNRARLEEDVETRLTLPGDVSVVAVDVLSPEYLNHFIKALGHVFDQHVLREVKTRLEALLPADCPLYRVSSTRLAFILQDHQLAGAAALFERIVEAFERPLVTDRIPVFTQLGLGVLPLTGGRPPMADWLRLAVSAADWARLRGQGWAYYDPRQDAQQQRAFILLSSLADAVRSLDQLRLVYQPRLSLEDGRCVAAEALLRWRHPVLGEISPGEFIPLAEQTMLIRPLGRWVVSQALKQLVVWQRAGLDIKLSINVSATDLEDAQFCNELERLLALHAVAPAQLELEFTESALMQEPETVRVQLERIRALGVEVAIDDFGAGYSNWTYLRALPASIVKLDQSFLRALDNDDHSERILRAMIELARELGYRVVAEGIETELQYRLMRDWGCDEGQGYYIARPLEAAALPFWLVERRIPAKLERAIE